MSSEQTPSDESASTFDSEALRNQMFGDERFQKSNPQIKLQMALARATGAVNALVTNPSIEVQQRSIVAVSVLQELIPDHMQALSAYEQEEFGGWTIVRGKKESIE